MWSTLKISSGAQLGHDKWEIPAFDTVLFHSDLSSLRRKHLSDVPTDKLVLSSGAKISKRPLKRGHWWLKNKEGKCHFRFVERRFLAAINLHRKRRRSARASPSPHHTLDQERTASFTARSFSALVMHFKSAHRVETQLTIELMTFALTRCTNILVGCLMTPTFFGQVTSFTDSFH